MRRISAWTSSLAIAATAAVVFGVSAAGQAPAAPPAGGAAPGQAGGRAGGGGRGAGGGGVAPALFTAADINKDAMLTRAELMGSMERWYGEADQPRTGGVTSEQLTTVLAAAFPAPAAPAGGRGGAGGPACGGNSPTKTPCPEHVEAMLKALPATAPAKPAKPRKILVLGNSGGFVHSSIPLAAKMVEAMGDKYKTWTTKITYDPSEINTENLKQYDMVFLSSTTGCFLDAVPGQPVPSKNEIEARRAALLAFVRSGKGLGGVHAATDSYHGTCPGDQPADGARGGRGGAGGRGAAGAAAFTPGGQLATQIVTAADKNTDQKVSLVEIDALANAWFDTMDTDKRGVIMQADFPAKFASLTPAPAAGGRGGGRGAGGAGGAPPVARGSQVMPAAGSWPEFNKMIGGYFKFHWVDGTHIPVKIDDPKSPINKAFVDKTVEASNGSGANVNNPTAGPAFSKAVPGQGYEIVDETYTFAQDSFSRTNVHVLTSVDYDKMPAETKAQEPAANARMDGDYALSYIRKEGQGRVFYEANGHNERIYSIPAMAQHMLAGIQYALGDLKADDSPSVKPAAAAKQ